MHITYIKKILGQESQGNARVHISESVTARFNIKPHYRGSEGLNQRDNSAERKTFWVL